MCDTMVRVRDGEVLFAKNSDRDANEAQVLDWYAAASHPDGSTIETTYMEIPQVAETAAVLLSRPFWMWGAEMGANEHGVVIGNEAVFTREPTSDTGLTGMDLLRLALERARSADEAVEVIVSLLETHGQGGGCGFEDRSFTYHNSFIVADPAGATVVETAARRWATEKVDGARSISNGLTIEGFADRFSDRLKTRTSACRVRQPHTQRLAGSAAGLSDMASILRSHGDTTWPTYKRINGTLHMPCMHGGSDIASSVSAGSWISHLGGDGHSHWATATAAPCISLFKPVWVADPIEVAEAPEGTADESLWWLNERLHRKVMVDPEPLAATFVPVRDHLERTWFTDPPSSREAFATHRRLLTSWIEALPETPDDVRPRFAQKYWAKRNRAAGLD